MTWKFWKWDITGRSRLAALEKRIKELEQEINPKEDFYALSYFTRLWSFNETDDCNKPLRLHEKVRRLCDHVGIEFVRTRSTYETRRVKKSSR